MRSSRRSRIADRLRRTTTRTTTRRARSPTGRTRFGSIAVVGCVLESRDPRRCAAVKFVHAADLHVDSPLRGLERYEGAPVGRLRGASRRALENLVTLCLEEQVAFVILAGD